MRFSHLINLTILVVYALPWALSLIDLRFLIVAIGVIFVNAANQALKYSLGTRHAIFKRPSDACDCSLIVHGGDCGSRPGFPSGHVATVAGLCVLLAATFGLSYGWIPLFVLYTAAMAWARVAHGCHTHYQVAAGMLSGAAFALFFIKIAGYIKWTSAST